MNITDAINYLEDKNISHSDHFKVLTGFDSATNQYNPELGWIASLRNKKIFEYMCLRDFTSVQNRRSLMALGAGYSPKEKAILFQSIEASKLSPNQTNEQRKLVDLIIDLFNEHQHDEKLSVFNFDDPAVLLRQDERSSKTKRAIL